MGEAVKKMPAKINFGYLVYSHISCLYHENNFVLAINMWSQLRRFVVNGCYML